MRRIRPQTLRSTFEIEACSEDWEPVDGSKGGQWGTVMVTCVRCRGRFRLVFFKKLIVEEKRVRAES